MATKQEEEKAASKNTAKPVEQPQENIAQPNKGDKDSQAYIKENAKKGESVHDPLASKTMREGINVETGGDKK